MLVAVVVVLVIALDLLVVWLVEAAVLVEIKRQKPLPVILDLQTQVEAVVVLEQVARAHFLRLVAQAALAS
jgi:uncharacterized SAM-binding protein YcdF (DUF218 family)